MKYINILLFFIICKSVVAQHPSYNLPISKYGLPVVNDVSIYKKIVLADADNMIIDMHQLIPDAKFDVTYATANNIINRPIYPSPDLFMRRPAALALQKVQQQLKKQGLGLVLYDGYRPYEVTVLFYEVVKDTTFVADPHKGSKHNRGMAIDLSLYDLKTGKTLPMPSAYDETTPRAFHSYTGATKEELENREILRTAMENVGFAIYPWEWWHYDFKGWESCYTYDLWHSVIRKANSELTKE